MLDHVATQIAGVAEAGVALQTHAGFLPGVSPHVDLQASALCEALPTLDAHVRLLTGVYLHMHGTLGLVGHCRWLLCLVHFGVLVAEEPFAAVQVVLQRELCIEVTRSPSLVSGL